MLFRRGDVNDAVQQLLERIGKGAFGTVYRGVNLLTGATVAVKRIGLHGLPESELETIGVSQQSPNLPAPAKNE